MDNNTAAPVSTTNPTATPSATPAPVQTDAGGGNAVQTTEVASTNVQTPVTDNNSSVQESAMKDGGLTQGDGDAKFGVIPILMFTLFAVTAVYIIKHSITGIKSIYKRDDLLSDEIKEVKYNLKNGNVGDKYVESSKDVIVKSAVRKT